MTSAPNPIVFRYTESKELRAEWFAVHADGSISRPECPHGPLGPSGRWIFTGLANGHGRTVYTLESLLASLRAGEEVKRGKFHVADIDHGTRRLHGAKVELLARGPGLFSPEAQTDSPVLSVVAARKVRVSAEGVARFNAQWPSSTLRGTRAYWFEFDSEGDLVDTDCPEHDDGPAASAMADDCKAYLFDGAVPDWAT